MLLGLEAAAQTVNPTAQVTLHEVPITVTASSVLEDAKNAGRYAPANLLDEDPGTIWAEGVKGNGVGEWVELGFPPGTPVEAFLVTPGNPKSPKLYQANARPRKARLELKLEENKQLNYEFEFPRNFPAGGSIYVAYARKLAVLSARLTVVSVWPGKKYRDLCIANFIPVFRDAEKSFRGQGKELAPTLAVFMSQSTPVQHLLPSKEGDEPAWLRTYQKVPHDGPLRSPVQASDLRKKPLSEWGDERHALYEDRAGAWVQSELFRLTPAPRGMGYVFDPLLPPKQPDAFANFRIRWRMVDGQWRILELDLKYREETPP
ncbi:NADase-type glycan-binding domain-containing protein [Cystobacter fuscus]|uniref:NADase-type glycan-binding domain-containing protein n=1 Tax=Cystobacter fuscus TaxID=43 RepID=UPI0012FE45BE|nr:hypothetical protein [Cystobacter fuscus]